MSSSDRNGYSALNIQSGKNRQEPPPLTFTKSFLRGSRPDQLASPDDGALKSIVTK
jgi:hypothetical protein